MSKSIISAAALFALTALVAPQSAMAACGEILVSKGDVKIETASTAAGGSKVSPAPVGSKVCQGDTVIAGAQSRAKVKMEDGNELNISPDSRIMLETYEYKAADNKKKVMLNVLYGKVRAATREENMYNDKAKDGQANTFQVKTKSAVAGVRGTDFLTGFNRQTQKTDIVTFRGKVEFGQMGPGGKMMAPVMVGAGQKTEMVPGMPPAPPKMVPKNEMKEMNMQTGGGQARSPSAGAGGSSMASSSDLGTTDTSQRSPSSTANANNPAPASPPPPPPPPKTLPQLPVIPTPPTPPPTPPPGPGKVNITIQVPK